MFTYTKENKSVEMLAEMIRTYNNMSLMRFAGSASGPVAHISSANHWTKDIIGPFKVKPANAVFWLPCWDKRKITRLRYRIHARWRQLDDADRVTLALMES